MGHIQQKPSYASTNGMTTDLALRLNEQMQDAVMVLDLYGRVQAVNREACRRIGFPASDLVGAVPSIWMAEPTDIGTVVAECLREGRWLGEFSMREAAGELHRCEVMLSPLTGPDGKVTAVFTVSREIGSNRRT